MIIRRAIATFFRIFVAREVALDVAEIALNAEADGERTHDLGDFIPCCGRL